MVPITDFKGLVDRFYTLPKRPRVVVTCPYDEPTDSVVTRCLTDAIADVLLVTDGRDNPLIQRWQAEFPEHVEVYATDNYDEACRKSVSLINEGKADVIMKGTVNTDNLLRAVLDKQHGLLPQGHVMSHVAVAEIPAYHKLLIFSDAAVIPQPNLEQFDTMISFDVEMARRLGHTNPRVALVHFTEKVNPKFQCTVDYTELIRRAADGKYGEVRIGGPMDIKTACDPHSGQLKGIETPVAGDADVAILPDLECANAFYKSLVLFGGSRVAAMLIGPTAPVVAPSRADSGESKFFSLALACVAGLDNSNSES